MEGHELDDARFDTRRRQMRFVVQSVKDLLICIVTESATGDHGLEAKAVVVSQEP